MKYILILTILSGHGQAVAAINVSDGPTCTRIGDAWVAQANRVSEYASKFFLCLPAQEDVK